MQIVLNPQRVRLSNLCPWAASWVGCREGGALDGAGESCRLQTVRLALKLFLLEHIYNSTVLTG